MECNHPTWSSVVFFVDITIGAVIGTRIVRLFCVFRSQGQIIPTEISLGRVGSTSGLCEYHDCALCRKVSLRQLFTKSYSFVQNSVLCSKCMVPHSFVQSTPLFKTKHSFVHNAWSRMKFDTITFFNHKIT